MTGPSPGPAAADVIWLSDVVDDNGGSVGGKASGLAALLRAGERVPDGFCITSRSTRRGDRGVGRDRGRAPGGDPRCLCAVGGGCGGGPVERHDGGSAAGQLAGQRETVLNVCGGEALLEAVQRCWDSLSSPRAVACRRAAGIAEESARMAVVVQRMVDPGRAGVLFTANPVHRVSHGDGRRCGGRVWGMSSWTAASSPTTTSWMPRGERVGAAVA